MSEEPLALPLALVVGINRYPFLPADPQGKPKHLESPARSAEDIAKLLHEYGKFHVTRFPSKPVQNDVIRFPCKTVQDADEDADEVDPHPSEAWRKSDLEEKIKNLFRPPSGTPPKKALLFFAGHGLRVEEDVFLLTSDAIPHNPGKEQGISLKWLSELLANSPVQEQIVWLDCCYSGKLLDFFSEHNQHSNDSKKRCFILASRGFESAYEQHNREYGLLSGALIRGLKTYAGFTSKSLKDYIREQLRSTKQIPVVDQWSHEITITQIDFDTSTIAPQDWDEIDNNPETLQTIGKYLLELEHSCWRLYVYEKFLSPQVLSRDDYKATVKSLVDIGVILEDQQGLRIAKGIYKKAFDWEWLKRHLPPYAQSFMDWSDKDKDESHLLQKDDLKQALDWLADKERLNESEVEFIIRSLVWNIWPPESTSDTNQANMAAVNIVKEFITRLKNKTDHVYLFIQKCLEHTAIKPKLLEKLLGLVCQCPYRCIGDPDRFIQQQIELIHRNEILNAWIRAYEEKISENYLDYPCPDNPKTIIDRAFYEFVQVVTRHLQFEGKFSTVEDCINYLSDNLINEHIWNEDERPTIEATEHEGKKVWKITVAQCSYKEECTWALKEPKFTQNGQYRCQRLGCCVGAVKSLNNNLKTDKLDYLMTTVMDEQQGCQGFIFIGDRNLKRRKSLSDHYSTKFPTK